MAEAPWMPAEERWVFKLREGLEHRFVGKSSRAKRDLWVLISRLLAEKGYTRTGLECNHLYRRMKDSIRGRALSQEVKEELAAEKAMEQQEIMQEGEGTNPEVEAHVPDASTGVPDLNLSPPDSPETHRCGDPGGNKAAMTGQSSRTK